MDQEFQDIQSIIAEINQTVNDIRERPLDNKIEVPSNLSLMLDGVKNNAAVSLLFSTGMDKIIDKLLFMVESGQIEKFLTNEENILQTLAKLGFGQGVFHGTLSRNIIDSIKNSVNTKTFQRTKSSLLKALYVVNNLNKLKRKVKDEVLKKKYEDTIYAIKRILKLVSKIYRNRKIINDRVIAGLRNLVHENVYSDKLVELNFE